MKRLTKDIRMPGEKDKVPFPYIEFESIDEAVTVLGEARVLEYINWKHHFDQQVAFRSGYRSKQ